MHHQLYAQLSKRSFGKMQIDYLGHIVLNKGVEIDSSKVAAIVQWHVPQSLKHIRAFLGLSGYYRKFIKQYATLVKPLTDLLKKDSFCWLDATQHAFNTLKQAMISAPILALPNFDSLFILETNASGVAIGAVLSLDKHPIAYFSRKMSQRMQHQAAYVCELFATAEYVNKFRHYLLG